MKRIVVFLLVFLAVFSVTMWPWTAVRSSYAVMFREVCGFFLSTVGENGRVEFETSANSDGKSDSQARLWNARTGAGSGFDLNTRYTGYVPTALVFSLAVATPYSIRRRFRSLLWGMLAIHGFVFLRVLVTVWYVFSQSETMQVMELGSAGRAVVRFAFAVLAVSSAGNFVLPVLIWGLSSFRRSDWYAVTMPVPAGKYQI